jgi:hypothetical protein
VQVKVRVQMVLEVLALKAMTKKTSCSFKSWLKFIDSVIFHDFFL